MQNSQSSEPIVTQLLEIDNKLATKEVELTLQLQSIQEKRHSLKNVISLFPPLDNTTPTTVAELTPVVEDVAAPPVQEEITPDLDEGTTETTEAAPQPPKRQGKRNLSTNDKPSKKSAPAKNPSQQPDTWQQYVIGEFSNAPLAEAVAQVMQQHSKQIIEIATIIDAIFTNEIPKELRSTARERVSNVLSVGAKSGKWYRGQLGKYSMSKAAVVDDLIT